MYKKILITLGILLSVNLMVYSQQGELKGKVTDKETKQPIPFANIVVEQGGRQFGAGTSDFDGKYTIKPLPSGKYNVKATYVGYKTAQINGVVITSNTIQYNDIILEPTSQNLTEVIITDYKIPLISKDQTQSGETVTSEEISKMPGRSAESIAATVGGVFSQDGSMGSVRGQREDGTVTFIDGVRVRGSSGLPKSAIEEVGMILGGTPAKYGEATGGILNIVTKGPSREFGGSVEIVSSELWDKQGYNVASFSLNGPLLKSKDPNQRTSLLGFFISGEFSSIKDTRPFANGDYKVNDAKRKYLEQNPISLKNVNGNLSVFYNSSYLRASDLEKIYTKENGQAYSVNFAGKIDVRTTPNTNLTFGGSVDWNKGRSWDRANEFLNSSNNGEYINSTWRVYGKFSQRFPGEKDSKSLVKNVYYQIQVDYTKVNSTSEDVNHKDNLFEYGYVGKFKTYKTPYFQIGSDTVNGVVYNNVWVLSNVYDTLVTYQRSEVNPTLANYTSQYYSLFNLNSGYYQNYTTIQQYKALLNGQSPASVYGLINNTGSVYNGYGNSEETQFSINANGSADIGNHAFEFGIQYEQLVDRSYSLSPVGLWTLMRNLANRHIRQLDTDNPTLHPGGLIDTIYYDFKYSQIEQSFFDYNLRKVLGMAVDGHKLTDWIDIDNYSPNLYKINMFSADELLNQGKAWDPTSGGSIGYYGYDYTGQKLSKQPTLQDFFTAKDEYGNYKREIGAFQPLYMAGYIQDKFAFSDLIFNIGVRIDRFDANQMVLKDPYLLYASKTVQDVSGTLNPDNGGVHPSSVASSAVVYVDDFKATVPKILGYRVGEVWYNATGSVITDPTLIKGISGKPTPYRVNPNQSIISVDAFQDYSPQTTFMPRISFSFPISDEALFFAHYDVVTKRPTTGLRLDPTSYLFIEQIAGTNVINNPNLLPERTTDYELGFQQKLSNSSSLKFSAYYREIRNLVQAKQFAGADPINYISYTNIDFGTVKGMTISYDLRRTSNVRIRTSYTLQFANGTGSSATDQINLVSSGQPNLRTIYALNYDQRHAVKANFDFRFDEGKKYNGPTITKKIKGTDKVKTVALFENTGLNITFNGGSGTPYTKRNIIGNTIEGNLNGSRLPWQFWIDAQIDRDIMLKVNKSDGKSKKLIYLNIYVQLMNVLNTTNTIGVYSTTGNPNDDGYLSAAQNQSTIASQVDAQSYRDIRSVMYNNPNNYSLPRRIRLGLVLNF